MERVDIYNGMSMTLVEYGQHMAVCYNETGSRAAKEKRKQI